MERIKNVEVLITTMNMKSPYDLLTDMNIKGPALIGNQCDYNLINQINYNKIIVTIFSFNERGVGLNRNNLLMRSNAHYILFGDDDLVYMDNYIDIVNDSFKKYKDADLIIFNLSEPNSKRFRINKDFKVNYFNFMRFGAARIAVKNSSIKNKDIYFNLNFGGGTKFGSGEDTIFILNCLKKGLKIYAVNKYIAHLENKRQSTWFTSYNKKYFMDKGALYRTMNKRLCALLCLQDAIRHKKIYKKKWKQVFKMMLEGSKNVD